MTEEEELLTPEEEPFIYNLREEVPEIVPVTSELTSEEEPRPSDYQEWDEYVYDLLEFRIGFDSDSGDIDLAGNIRDIWFEEKEFGEDIYEVIIDYKFRDNTLTTPEGDIEGTEDIPRPRLNIEAPIQISYETESYRDLRAKTVEAAEELQNIDYALTSR